MIQELSIAARTGMSHSTPTGREYLKDLILVLTKKEVKVRYQSTCLGYAWSVLNPLAFAVVYYLAFGVFMQVRVQDYTLFLIAGLFPWQWVSHSIATAPNIFLANATLIKKVRFPWNALVVAVVMNYGIHFWLSLPIILGFVLWHGVIPSPIWLLGVPLLSVAQFVLLYGIALALASLNLFFRDLDRLTALVVTFLFFLTPIAYSSTMIPERYHLLLYVNPIAPIMQSWQTLFLSGRLPWDLVLAGYAMALTCVAVGIKVYQKFAPRFGEVL